MLDVITIGGATIDAFLTINNSHKHCRFNKDTNELCIRHGDKIEVDTTEFCLGGNACNVAVGLSRLGLSAALCAEVGNDEFSDKIFSTLYAEKVDFRLVKRSSAPTSFAVGIHFQGERTLFVQHVKRSHFFDFTDVETQWVYLTSLGEDWIEAYKKVLHFVGGGNTSLAFSPGGHQLQSKEEVVQEVLRKTTILFVNKQEAELLVEQYGTKTGNVLKDVQVLGPKIVVITDGKNGSIAADEKGSYEYGIVDVKIVEKTGAGDGYAAAFLAAIINKKSIQEAMEWGTKNSAAVIGKVGAQAGLLTKEEIMKLI